MLGSGMIVLGIPLMLGVSYLPRNRK